MKNAANFYPKLVVGWRGGKGGGGAESSKLKADIKGKQLVDMYFAFYLRSKRRANSVRVKQKVNEINFLS